MAIVNIDDSDYVKLYRKYDSSLAIRWYHKLLKYNFIVPIFKLIPFDRSIMDIGCARGKFLLDMKRYGYTNLSGLDVACTETALDPDTEATFFQASITGDDFHLDRSMMIGDAAKKNLPDQFTYDAVFVQNMLHHLPVESLPAVAKNIASLCKPGGHVLIYDVNRTSMVGRLFYHGFLRLFPEFHKAAAWEQKEQLEFCEAWPRFLTMLQETGLQCLSRSEWSFYKALVLKKSSS